MSYDIRLSDPVTGEALSIDAPHHMRGGTYCVGGTDRAELNITYNYGPILHRVLPDGIRGLYGRSGAESIPLLKSAIADLGNDTDPDYWAPTEGNVKQALNHVLALAHMRPDGVWSGD